MFTRKNILAALALVMLPVFACQASWMRQEGEVAASIGTTLADNGNFFDRNGHERRSACSSGQSLPLYGEYGLSYYNTLYVNTSLAAYNCGGGQQSGFTDFELGTRGRFDLFRNDKTWELAAIIPSAVDPLGAARTPKNFGIKLGIHSSDRVDPYQSFNSGSDPLAARDTFSYGAGLKLWAGHIPDELFGYLGWGHNLSNSDFNKTGTGGWYFSARLDGSTSIDKEHTVTPGIAQVDTHDKWSLLSGQLGLSHSLTPFSTMHLSLHKGLVGTNRGSPSNISVSYSKVWRD
jgi:hypothetical protein